LVHQDFHRQLSWDDIVDKKVWGCQQTDSPLEGGRLRMINLEEFRAGAYSLPGGDADELPDCCFQCVYLQVKGFSVSLSDTFYYFCAYSWPDKLTQTEPPCLEESKPTPALVLMGPGICQLLMILDLSRLQKLRVFVSYPRFSPLHR
jgi:hypothetical protein